jgi:hypothetical protein
MVGWPASDKSLWLNDVGSISKVAERRSTGQPGAAESVLPPGAVPDGVWVVAQVPSLAGLDLSHFLLPGTHVPGFLVPPLRGW